MTPSARCPRRCAPTGWHSSSIPGRDPGARFLNHLGQEFGIDVATWWRPTARNYFDRLRKDAILDVLDEVGGGELRSRYAGSKKHDVAASAEKLFAGDTIVEAEVKERALAWLPDAMRFVTPVVGVGVDPDGQPIVEPEDGSNIAARDKPATPRDEAA